MKGRRQTGRSIGRSIGMKVMAVILCGAMAMFSAGCGQDDYKVEYGVDGYVYVPQKLQSMDNVEDMQVVGEALYYMQRTDNKTTVNRVSVAELAAGEGRLDFSESKKMASFQNLTFELPEEVGEGGEEIDFLSAMDGGYQKSNAVNLEKNYGRLMLEKYAAAPDGTLCFFLSASMGGFFEQVPVGGVLCRQNAEGKQIYRVYIPEMLDLAVDTEGRGIVLTGEGIRILDGDGNQKEFLSTEECRTGGKILREELFTDSEGRIYYTYVNEDSTKSRATYEITGGNSFRLKKAGALLGDGLSNHSAAAEGDVFQYAPDSEGSLYLYERKTDSRKKLLNWLESGLMSTGISSVAGVTPEILIVSYYSNVYGGESGIYQLTRTPVEELPEKELLVIASPSSSFNLQKAAMLFNARSSTHRVVLESYGAEFRDGVNTWECPRLDASLVSPNPPDMLNLGVLNTVKYARMGVLEDLSPYLEGSSIDREDIPENLLEGYTFDGRLVSVPAVFSISGLIMRAAQVRDLDGWAMEDLYKMTEQHPESIGGAVGDGYRRMGDGYVMRKESSWLLEKLCARYYLEEFIDWEKRECCFDSEAFSRLIEWAGTYGWDPGHVEQPNVSTFWEQAYIQDDMLIVEKSGIGFTTLVHHELQFQEEVCLKGYPTADGREYFPARTSEGLGICADSSQKEAAWDFLELYREVCQGDLWSGDIPASIQGIRELYEKETTPDYSGGGDSSEPVMKEKSQLSVENDYFPYYYTPQDQADAILHAIETADFTPMSEEEEIIVSIVAEETGSYYSKDKSLEDVAKLIQNRVQLILDEKQ